MLYFHRSFVSLHRILSNRMKENSLYDKKSLRAIYGRKADFKEIAKDCVAFCNAEGGVIDFGIEDGCNLPDASQVIPEELPTTLINRMSGLTVGVSLSTEVSKAKNGGEILKLHIFRNPNAIATTSSGLVYYRRGDNSEPISSEDLSRLAADKGCLRWEDQDSGVSIKLADEEKLKKLIAAIKESDRVSDFVKAKDTRELLDHFSLTVPDSESLTNLGVLFVGKAAYRARLNSALVIQCIKYDEYGDKINKWLWDDFSMTPAELVDDIWKKIPDWKESYEVPDGLTRRNIPAYDESVIRELLSNSLVHRPYTIRGDIFINIYPDRVEVRNPGRLPLGITPDNILHKTIKRNEHMATLFYVLHLMEREGSGYDLMYAVQLSQGKQVPVVVEDEDSVTAIVKRRIVSMDAVKLMLHASQNFELKQKQVICLGLVAQNENISAHALSKLLGLDSSDALRSWLRPLLDLGLVIPSAGKTSAIKYQVAPQLLQDSNFKGKTTLKRVEDYRIRELIIEDLRLYKRSSISDINQRIGTEISHKKLLTIINELIDARKVKKTGVNRWAQYELA